MTIRAYARSRLHDELLAVRFPRPDVKEKVRRLPQRPPRPEQATLPEPASLPEPAPLSATRPRGRAVEPIAADRYKVQFTADARLRELLDRACAPCGHSASDVKLAHVVERARGVRWA